MAAVRSAILNWAFKGRSSNAASAATPPALAPHQFVRSCVAGVADADHEHRESRLLRRFDPLLLEREEDTFQAHPEPDAGDVRPAQHLGQPSYRPPPNSVACCGERTGLTNSNAVRV